MVGHQEKIPFADQSVKDLISGISSGFLRTFAACGCSVDRMNCQRDVIPVTEGLTMIDPLVSGGLKSVMDMNGFECDWLLRSHQSAKVKEDG
jgi:hypothetical protein